MEFNNSVFTIYWSLLERKFSIYVLTILKKWKCILSNPFSTSFSSNQYPSFFDADKTYLKRDSCNLFSNQSNIVFFLVVLSKRLCPNLFSNTGEKKNRGDNINDLSGHRFIDESYVSAKKSMSRESNKIKQMNRKLAWIEATLNDLDIWRHSYSIFSSSRKMENNLEQQFSVLESKDTSITMMAYESISLVPRSITRTLSRFKTELTGDSKSLILNEFRLAKYQALASIQYIGCLLFFPPIISMLSKTWFLESWITNWWNMSQSHIFLNFFQEERALKELQEMEELLWLDRVMTDYVKDQSQDLDIEIYEETIQLVTIYNEDSIQIISHLLTDIISIVTLIFLFIIGRKRLAVLNSWIQELFYSLSDTMKAFSILLLTDLCIGFHSPHGWEIVIGSFLEHLGFSHNKHIISCFVSTFPVILDTVFKYWIFRHLNRISPSIVATYHTMNE
uniref:Potassium/proton antiporter CemA n=1 Tax=Christensenia aesculifolia TaxID=491817 RepID=A0A5C0F540_9MONI|nr:chloroplast envelope membrane protein [Christensenia aesculifolia]QEI60342.1 chloroplast envelope membrane protein [Christensenia aesculifolia]